eukprot:443270-Pelagomonas_calceolata.AAC.3
MIVLHEAYHSLALPCKHLLDHLQEPCFAVPAPTSTSDVSGWLLLKFYQIQIYESHGTFEFVVGSNNNLFANTFG